MPKFLIEYEWWLIYLKLMFFDDSFQRDRSYLGYGGFCINESELMNLIADVSELKLRFGIPETVELKWLLKLNKMLSCAKLRCGLCCSNNVEFLPFRACILLAWSQ